MNTKKWKKERARRARQRRECHRKIKKAERRKIDEQYVDGNGSKRAEIARLEAEARQ